ncbi:mucin-1 [Sorex araneus]|uniref:mucin-1 n=1 Tax=Sorex araneus TaxID=42254 RepID=UPI00243409B8|nr:mucin-1 [Sorex araneus]
MSPTSSPSHTVPVPFSSFFLSFHISNYDFNASLENSHSAYYQMLQTKIVGLFSEIYTKDFVGVSNIQFREGSVIADSILILRNTTNAQDVEQKFKNGTSDAFKQHGLNITDVDVRTGTATTPSTPPGPRVPGWGIALLVLVCVLVALAVLYFLMLAVCQCRRKSCGELDLLQPRDAYHPMSEYPTYHTHGRYVPPGSTRRSPYEEASAGNGGGNLSYTNPAATSANL